MRILFFFILGAVAYAESTPNDFVSANNQFAVDLYKELLKSSSGNVLLCPLSAEIALALTYAGAKGVTAKQLSAGLHIPDKLETVRDMFKSVHKQLQDGRGYTLNNANRIYVDNKFSINPQFKDVAVNAFDAGIENVDFSKSQDAVSQINKWVEERTKNNIKNLVEASDVDSETRAVLINALFFQAKWANEFQKRDTKEGKFYLNTKDSTNADMMSQTTFFDYGESSDLKAKFLELSYSGYDSSMVFVLPNDKDGLTDLENNLEKVLAFNNYKRRSYVEVSIPKFKIETSIKLKPILIALGIEDPFEPTADFTEMGTDANNKRIFIQKVIQKNYLEIDEEGTIAASATAVFAGAGSSLPPPVTEKFIADHPFFFYIKKGDIVLFAGRVKELP